MSRFNAEFGSLQAEPEFNTRPSSEYSDTAIETSAIYQGVCNVDIRRCANTLRAILSGSHQTNHSGLVILHLAMNLASPYPDSGSTTLLDLPTNVESTWPDFSTALASINPSSQLAAAGGSNVSFSILSGVKGGDDLSRANTNSSENLTGSISDDFVKSAKFIAAYLLRLLVKSSQNAVTAWSKLPERFNNFYKSALDLSFARTPTIQVIDSIKMSLTSDPLIASTWVLAFNRIERGSTQLTTKYNLIKYLAILPLGYAGMHALKLFVSFVWIKKCDPVWLLNRMRSPENNPALYDIHKILSNWYPKKNDPGKGLFKYARLVDTSYFQDLQTKNCPSLIYLMVKMISEYCPLPPGADPNAIVGIATVSANVKNEMARAASLIVAAIPQDNASQYSAEMREAITGTSKTSTSNPKVISIIPKFNQ